MPEYSIQMTFHQYMHMYRDTPIPTIVYSMDNYFFEANTLAQLRYPMMCNPQGIALLLSELSSETLQNLLKQNGSHTIKNSSLFSDTWICIHPIYAKDCIIGHILIFLPPTASSQSESAFTQSMRATVSQIFETMDTLALKADLLQASWIKPSFNHIAASSYRILRITKNISIYNRFLQGKLEVHRHAFQFSDWLHDIQDSLTALGKHMGIAINFSITDSPCWMRADQSLLEALVFNIVHNSLYYTRENNSIDIALTCDEKNIEFSVEDRGLGIPRESLELVWRPYVTLHHNTEKNGMGLGLPLVKMIADLHHAAYTLQSAPNQGTRITLTFFRALPNGPLRMGQNDKEVANYLSDRFSSLYVGLVDAESSPLRSG